MKQAKQGDTVKVNYTGKLDDGSVFDTSVGKQPLEFKIGDGKILPDFEKAILDMKPGDKKTIKIEAENAYGQPREDMVITVDRKHLPENIEPKVGLNLQIKQENDQVVIVTIKEVNEDKITLDGNHPLAGKDLTFELELVEIV